MLIPRGDNGEDSNYHCTISLTLWLTISYLHLWTFSPLMYKMKEILSNSKSFDSKFLSIHLLRRLTMDNRNQLELPDSTTASQAPVRMNDEKQACNRRSNAAKPQILRMPVWMNEVAGYYNLSRYHLLTLYARHRAVWIKWFHLFFVALFQGRCLKSSLRLREKKQLAFIPGKQLSHLKARVFSMPPCLSTTEFQQGSPNCFLHTHPRRMGMLQWEKFVVENLPFTKLLFIAF